MLPIVDPDSYKRTGDLMEGAYILSGTGPVLPNWKILIATGSEVSLILQAQQKLRENGIAARDVVSIAALLGTVRPVQEDSGKQKILPKGLKKRLARRDGLPARLE